jgi:hypothetical protein
MARDFLGPPGAVWRGTIGKVRRRGEPRAGYGMEAQGNVSLTRRTTHSSAGAVAPAFYSSAVNSTIESNLGKRVTSRRRRIPVGCQCPLYKRALSDIHSFVSFTFFPTFPRFPTPYILYLKPQYFELPCLTSRSMIFPCAAAKLGTPLPCTSPF